MAERGREGRLERVYRRAVAALRLGMVLAAAVLGIRTFLLDAYRIPTSSMEETLLVGDFLFVNKVVFGIQLPGTSLRTPSFREPTRGDVIVFRPPHDPGRTYVKRIVGAPGDTVEMAEFSVWVNGVALVEPYAHYGGYHDPDYTGARVRGSFVDDLEAAAPDPLPPNEWGPVVVPVDSYFVLGDNRDNSEDSRFWGFVEREQIRGRPLFVYYSARPQAAGTDVEPAPSWWDRIRWARFGTPIR